MNNDITKTILFDMITIYNCVPLYLTLSGCNFVIIIVDRFFVFLAYYIQFIKYSSLSSVYPTMKFNIIFDNYNINTMGCDEYVS